MAGPRSIMSPAGFNGSRALRDHERGRPTRRSYFEGWYVKLVSADLSTRLAVIPEVFLSRMGPWLRPSSRCLTG